MFKYYIMLNDEIVDVETPSELFEKLLVICNDKHNIDYDVSFVVSFNAHNVGCSYEKCFDKQFIYDDNKTYKRRYIKKAIKHLHNAVIEHYLENALKEVQ